MLRQLKPHCPEREQHGASMERHAWFEEAPHLPFLLGVTGGVGVVVGVVGAAVVVGGWTGGVVVCCAAGEVVVVVLGPGASHESSSA